MQKLRLVEKGDMLLIFTWANDPEVRSNAFHTSSIPLKDHELWFAKKINNPGTLFLLLEVDGQPAGQIRYELEEIELVINYMISSDFRGLGLGLYLLQEGEKYILGNHLFPMVKRIAGYVKPDNIASIRTFQKAGYKSVHNENPETGIKFEKYILE